MATLSLSSPGELLLWLGWAGEGKLALAPALHCPSCRPLVRRRHVCECRAAGWWAVLHMAD